jgi:putative RNase toxin 47 of polymorphic toxin system
MGPKPKPGKLAEGSAKPLHTSESTTTKRLAPASTEKGKGGWAFNPKVDARVQTHDQAVQEAFRRTGVPLDEFKVTKVGKTADGKTIPVEWEVTSGPNRGAQVNIDDPTIVPTKEGPQVPHVGYQMPGKRSGGKALRGHIFPEEGVLASRGGLGTSDELGAS